MKIESIEVLICDGGWRPWIFVKITSDGGLIGYSEVTDSHGSLAGLKGVITELGQFLQGRDPRHIQGIYYDVLRSTRQTSGGLIQKGWAGIENALWDIKAKALGVPVYELLGGKVRDEIRLYWSHCGTTRVRAYQHTGKKPIGRLEDLDEVASEVLRQGFDCIKTNIILFHGSTPVVYHPGFHGPQLERNPERYVLKGIENWISAWRHALGEQCDLILDLNFNFNAEGNLMVGRLVEPFSLMWLEMDSYDPSALAYVTRKISTPVASGENLYTVRELVPFLERRSMDIAVIDLNWNGMTQSLRMAQLAEMYEMNIAPHNFYSHLATFMNAHLCAHVPNVRIMEVDVDDVPWKDEIVSRCPEIRNGHLQVPHAPGWGVDLKEDVIRAHPWTNRS